MSASRPVVVLAPRYGSLERFGGHSLEAHLTVRTAGGEPASLTNLEAAFGSPLESPRLSRGVGNSNPLAGYFLESLLKRNGYAARSVFAWEDGTALERALETDPLAVLFSTTFITDPETLAACLDELRRACGEIPLVVGGLYIHKQARALGRDTGPSRRRALAAHGVDVDADLLFGARPDPRITDAIYVGAEHGAHTALEVLARIERGGRRPADFVEVSNLVLYSEDGGWRATRQGADLFSLDRDYVRWSEIDELPAAIPVRTSLGCPCRCRFCDFHLLHPHATLRSIPSIVAELAEARGLGRGFISFVDDNIFPSTARATELARGIVDAELDLVWGGFFRADAVDEPTARAVHGAGCRFGFSGLESGDAGQLERMRREGDPARALAGIEHLTAAGVEMIATFLVGFPGETRESLDATAELIDRFPLENPGAVAFEIYPFYLSPGTAADAPGFRRRCGLRGRHGDWTHDTMSATEAIDRWSPYLFRAVAEVPYNYQTADAPRWWDIARRRAAFRARRALTIGFLDRADDQEIQRLFAELIGHVAGSGAAPEAPPWRQLLAEREQQPAGDP